MNQQKPISLKITILFLVVVFILGGIFFFLRDDTDNGEVVAQVGREVITRDQVDVRVRQSIVRSVDGGLSVPEDALFDRSLDDLITESLLYQDAIEGGFSADPEEVEARYNLVRSNYDTESAFLERMRANLLTPETFRQNLERQIVLFAYLEELKRLEIQAGLEKALDLPQEEDGASLEVQAETVPLTDDDIRRLSNERANELREQVKVEVFL